MSTVSFSLSIYLYISLFEPQRQGNNTTPKPKHYCVVVASVINMSPAASSRWCPTPEQLMILEEMYRSGIRTPNASQIQQITAHLSYHGKIEGKNVFYWFQNHKARDRQKLRRKLSKQLLQQQHQQLYHHQFQQNQPNHHLLCYFESPGSALQQLSYNNSASFLPQGGVLEDAQRQMMNYTWKVDIPDRVEMETPMMRTYNHDWMMMVDVGPASPCCTKPPLKTLELFPITATNLKEECTKNLYCTTTSIN